jgi:hypothetical protein
MLSVNKTWIANTFFALTFFSFGTAMMDYFLVYPSRVIVGTAEFVQYHTLLKERIIPISVLPFLLMTLLNVWLIFVHPPGLPKSLIWLSLVLLVLDWISTAFIQIPMNVELGKGKNTELIHKVMQTNQVRVVLESAQALVIYLLMQKHNRI